MNLIFNEYINFLKDNNIDTSSLKEGFYWLDRSIIKAYDKQGKIHKIMRISIDDKLNITSKSYDNQPFEIESWKDTVERNIVELNQLEKDSLELIQNSFSEYKDYKYKILSSGGKDSIVTSYLVRQIAPETEIIFNNTTLDCSDTYKYIKSLDNLKILSPKEGFYQWREKNNFVGNRMARACCNIFKEQETVNQLSENDKMIFFMGMRNEESATRKNYLDKWKNDRWGKREWMGILPIRKWTEEQIWLYIVWKNIQINPKYKKGYSRVGCSIACPYYTKSTWVLDKYWYPKMYKRWHDILENDFINNQKWVILNCTKNEYHTCWNGGVYRDEPTKEVIEEFANYKNISFELANKYFNKTCMCCNKKLKKDDVALSMKYYGRSIINFKCMKCLSKDLNIDTKKLKEKILEFKETGCNLF